MKSLARIALVVSLMISIGGHWGMLQAIAWARMIQDYSEEKGLVEGFKETFSGERPCPMCLKLRESQNEAGKNKAPISKEKTDLTLKWYDPSWEGAFKVTPPFPEASTKARLYFTASLRGEGRARPATPPPRAIQNA
ncbi:hypothetical protein DES53_102292 [Roseimicrobium gellanilyticum]|uniref:Uncharacterized protein n=1 Tax=Roseimicrobium gellanilyticum TaxID=748857 RepID=A0A366HS37_9BACT|nr:hypothetical protein [Roseimicrobium gellanilyticum]RBP45908.1 hypothetical protein DES53_102292 [Roseimicrobium gellanilyticum]